MPSRRKKTNKERPIVTKVVDLLEQNDPVQVPIPPTAVPQNAMPVEPPAQMYLQNQSNWPNTYAPVTAHHQSFPMPPTTSSSPFTLKWIAGT